MNTTRFLLLGLLVLGVTPVNSAPCSKPSSGGYACASTINCSDGTVVEVWCSTANANDCQAHQVVNGPVGIPVSEGGETKKEAEAAAREAC